MARKYFGTDGIRGKANQAPMDPETALRFGMAAGRVFTRGDHRHRVVIGKDTRLSGYMIEPALVAGFTSVGMDVFQLGPMPTPAMAMMTKSMRADIGVMISASHNPYYDNGIKLFGPDGYKLSDETELEIEALMDSKLTEGLASSENLGRAKRIDSSQDRYVELAKGTLREAISLDGLKIVIDCANGAAYKVAPLVLWELGAEVIPIGVTPNGFNINDNCGSTSPEQMCQAVRAHGADIGIALDGDADRVAISDELGRLVDGDQIMALIATRWARSEKLKGATLVSTVMSNLGLENYLASKKINLLRTQVGDRYVVAAMRAGGFNLGGEQSGHIVMSDFATTGDGLIAALQVVAEMVRSQKKVSEICHLYEPLPQHLENVRFNGGAPLEDANVIKAIAAGEAALGKTGRVLIRKSGTEPLIRVMAEAEDKAQMHQVIDDIVAAVKQAAG